MNLFGAFAGIPRQHVDEKLIETFSTRREATAKMNELNWPRGDHRSPDRKGYDYFMVKKT